MYWKDADYEWSLCWKLSQMEKAWHQDDDDLCCCYSQHLHSHLLELHCPSYIDLQVLVDEMLDAIEQESPVVVAVQ